MKVVQINTFPNKATGNIMMNIHKYLHSNNVDSYVIWGRGREPENDHEFKIGGKYSFYFDVLKNRITDKAGFYSKNATKKLISILECIKPDVVNLHNIHGYYLNIEMLWDYIRRKEIKVVWTFHDCWPFTGHCAYYTAIRCEKWKSKCERCPQKSTYPQSWFMDNSSFNYQQKKKIFLYDKLTIVAPCKWMKEQVEQSFFKGITCRVIYNGIDTEIFKPCHSSSFRQKHHLENKFIILGIASEWTERKGLPDFFKLAKKFEKQGNLVIVLVGLSKKQIQLLPDNILGIERTNDQRELAEIYSTADVFFNPTREDNFPTVNLEALSCGTPVICYNTGGESEISQAYIIDSIDDFELKSHELKDDKVDFGLNHMCHEYLMCYKNI